jgi:molecular chaperone Hsp33
MMIMSEDALYRFSFAAAPIRGQWVRLEGTLDALFAGRGCPAPVQSVLAEMLAAVSLAADGIKFRGAVALQARGPGPVTTILAECREQHLLRGLGRWQSDADLDAAGGDVMRLLGEGQMTLSLVSGTEAGADPTTYQGIVSLTNGSLAENLEAYFENSEQLPTRLLLAWDGARVTGLLLQRLPAAPNATEMALEQHGALWQEALVLADSLRAEELARWSVEDLLRRLFHEHALMVQPPRALSFSCTCSRERSATMLQALPKQEILELLEERGTIEVTCEICGARYDYDAFDTHALYAPPGTGVH